MDKLRQYSDPDPAVVAALKQDVADDVIKNHVIAFANGVQKWIWLPLDENHTADTLGADYKGLPLPDRTPLPAYTSYQTIVGKLDNFTSSQTIFVPGIFAYQFMVNGKTIYVLWSSSATTVDFSR